MDLFSLELRRLSSDLIDGNKIASGKVRIFFYQSSRVENFRAQAYGESKKYEGQVFKRVVYIWKQLPKEVVENKRRWCIKGERI